MIAHPIKPEAPKRFGDPFSDRRALEAGDGTEFQLHARAHGRAEADFLNVDALNAGRLVPVDRADETP